MASTGYETKKRYYDDLITLFGRKPVLEALRDPGLAPVKLHLADSNKPTKIISEMVELAGQRKVPIAYHERKALSRISRNGRQDQGVALDLSAPGYQALDTLLSRGDRDLELLALDCVTNPQNLGMVIRSVGGSPSSGLVLARKGNAPIDGLVIKASAWTIFKAPVYHCEDLSDAISQLKASGFRIVGLAGEARKSITEIPMGGRIVFVLGNETHGLSSNIRNLCDEMVRIPLANNVESLNVSAAATIVAFRSLVRAG